MVLVEIDSNAILVEPMKSRKDAEMIRAYDVLVQRLQQTNIHPRKHVLDNEISENMKQHIKDKYKFELELVPRGAIDGTQPKSPSAISNPTFSAYSQERPNHFHSIYGTDYYHKPK